MDLFILIIAVGLAFFIFKSFRKGIYFIGVLEIFFRLIHTIGDMVGFDVFNNFVNKYIPTSILDLFAKYSSGVLYTIFVWALVAIFAIFEFYLIKSFFKKK